MLARILFLLLLTMNLAAGAWWYLRAQEPRPVPAAVASTAPTLVLLNERDNAAMSKAAVVANAAQAATDPNAPPAVCSALGPFANETDLRIGMELLTPQVTAIQFQESSTVNTRGYWVYLPALNSRDAALKSARQLNAAGVRDYYVVTAGPTTRTRCPWDCSATATMPPAGSRKSPRSDFRATGRTHRSRTRLVDRVPARQRRTADLRYAARCSAADVEAAELWVKQ